MRVTSSMRAGSITHVFFEGLKDETSAPSRPSGSKSVAKSLSTKFPTKLTCGLSVTRTTGVAAVA